MLGSAEHGGAGRVTIRCANPGNQAAAESMRQRPVIDGRILEIGQERDPVRSITNLSSGHFQIGPPMRILIVEDEEKLANYLRKGLTEQGYVVDVAHDGIDGKHFALHSEYDLLLLDVMLPGIDGFGLLAAVREARTDTPVLMLTARDRVEDRVRGLEAGADDYLVKPFAFSELLARLHALGRRGRSSGYERAETLTLGASSSTRHAVQYSGAAGAST